MNINDTDPRNVGVSGLKGLNYQNPYGNPDSIDYRKLNTLVTLSSPGVANVGYSGAGDSKYDRNTFLTQEDYYNLSNYRGESQPGVLQIANGLAKGVALAGTTFLDGTVGLVIGAGNAISQKDASQLWDNDFSRGLKQFTDSLEETLPNYYSDKENDRKWYQNILTSNFIGDKLIKNLGFTVGAYYSGAVWTKPLSLISAIANTGVGATVASGLGASLSAVNEGRIEALNNSTDWFNLQKAQLDDNYNKELASLDFYKGTSSYNELVANLQTNYQSALEDLNNRKDKVGNIDMLFNLPILLASNLVEFSKLYSRGFNTATKLNNIAGTPGSYTSTMSKLGKTLAGFKAATSEGTEEVLQQLASNVAGNLQLPQKEYNLSLYNAGIDDEAEQQTLSWMKAFANGLNQTLNDSSTFEQFFIGALTGALGMPTFGRANNADAWLGKNKPIGLSGGVIQAVRDYNEEWEQTNALIEQLNQRVQSPEFLNYYQGLIRHNKFQNDMNSAVEEGKAKEFKDAEYAQMISDISMFAKAGKLNDYKDLLNSAFDTSDENLESIITNTTSTQEVDGKTITIGPFIDKNGNPMTSNENTKKEMIDSLNSRKNEMDEAVTQYIKLNDELVTQFGGVLSDSQINELVWYKMLSKNQSDRAIELAKDTKTILQAMTNSISEKLNNLTISEDYYNQPNTSNSADDAEAYRESLRVINQLLTLKDNELAIILGGNKPIRDLIIDAINDETSLQSTAESTKVLTNINDITRLLKDSTKFAEKVREFTTNPEKLVKEQAKQTRSEEKKIKTRKTNELSESLKNVTSVEALKTLIPNIDDPTALTDTEKKALSESNTKVVTDYIEVRDTINGAKSKARSVEGARPYLNDVDIILNNALANASTPDQITLDSELFKRNDIEGLTYTAEAEFNKVIDIIRKAIEMYQDSRRDDTGSIEFDESSIDAVSKGVDPKKAVPDKEVGIEEQTPTPAVNTVQPSNDVIVSDIKTTKTSDETEYELKPTSEPDVIDESTQDNAQNILSTNAEPSDNIATKPWSPAMPKYQRTPLHKGQFVQHTNEKAITLLNFLNSKGAFKFTEDGYLREGDTVYFGIEPSFSDNGDNPLVFEYVKSRDTYQIIGSNFVNPINEYSSQRTLNALVRQQYSESNHQGDGPFISSITTTVKEVKPGYINFTDETHDLKQILTDSGLIQTDEAGKTKTYYQLAIIDEKGVNTGVFKDIDKEILPIANQLEKLGSTYVAVPNSRQRTVGGKTLVHVNTANVTNEFLESKNTIAGDIRKAVQKLAEALILNSVYDNEQSILDSLMNLRNNLNLKYFDLSVSNNKKRIVVYSKDKSGNKTPVGDPIFLKTDDSYFIKDKGNNVKLSEQGVQFSKEVYARLLYNIGNAGLRIKVNKNFLNSPSYNQALLNSGLLSVNTNSLQVESGWFLMNPVDFSNKSQQSNPNIAEKKVTSKVTSIPSSQSSKAVQLFNKNRVGRSTDKLESEDIVRTNVTTDSLAKYKLELNKEYTINDILPLLNKIEVPFNKKVLKDLLTAANEHQIKYVFEEPYDNTTFGESGGDKVWLYTDPSDERFTHLILHETLHSFTSYILDPSNYSKLNDEQKNTVDKFNALYKVFQASNITNKFGANTKIAEFVAEMANPEFVQQLDTILVPRSSKTFWDKIKEFFAKLLGKSSSTQKLTNLPKELERLLDESFKYRLVWNHKNKMSNLSEEEEDILRRAPRDKEGHLLAPNDMPTNLTEKQYAQVRTKAFKEWFGDWLNDPENASKVVDENGEPLVVYHNSYNQFNTFSYDYIDNPDSGFFFTSDKEYANQYGTIQYPVFLNTRNPIDAGDTRLNRESVARLYVYDKNNADGIIGNDSLEDTLIPSNGWEINILNPNQIKSATDNIGTFSRLDNNIYKMQAVKELEELESGKPQLSVPLTDSEIKELINEGYSREWLDNASRNEIEYARTCMGF